MYFSEPRSCSLILWSACAFLSAVSSAAFADEKEKPVSANDLEAVEMGLVFNPVVRHTDTGRPVTLRQQTIINMAKKIVEIRRRSGDDAEDLKIRAKAAAELQARKKAVAARIAAGEKIVTKNFIIPGTTPQESKRIHSKNSGLRAADANDGSNRTQYVVKGNPFEDNADQTCAIGKSCIGPRIAKEGAQKEKTTPASQTQTKSLSSYQDVRVTRKKITREQAEELARVRGDGIAEMAAGIPKTTDQQHPRAKAAVPADSKDDKDNKVDEENLTAEEIYRRYFPDASLSPTKGWRGILEGLLGIFVSPTAASSSSSSSSGHAPENVGMNNPALGFTREDLLEIKSITEKAKKEGRETAEETLKNCPECKESKEIAPVQFSEIEERHREKARRLLNDIEAVKKLLKPQTEPDDATHRAEQNKRTNKLDDDSAAAPEPEKAQDMSFVFISSSLGDAAMRRIIRENAGRTDATLVLRGVKKGENLGKAVLSIQTMVRELHEQTGKTINIIIDPTLFELFGITAVPTVVRSKASLPDPLRKPQYEPIAFVKGLASDEWLLARIESGSVGDLGQQGPVYEIAEPDLIEEMKQRAASIDWEAKKNEAIARYWSNQKYEDFEKAEVTRTFEIDPTIIVTADIKDVDGILIRKAGERINPLEIRPFFKEVIFFDATDKEQRSRVRRFTQARDAAVKGYIGRIYISTRFDPEKGWDGYKELTDWLQAPLYQLQPGLAGRFGVVRVPSVVTADNDRKVFVVQELGKEKEKTARPNQDESEASAAKGEESK